AATGSCRELLLLSAATRRRRLLARLVRPRLRESSAGGAGSWGMGTKASIPRPPEWRRSRQSEHGVSPLPSEVETGLSDPGAIPVKAGPPRPDPGRALRAMEATALTTGGRHAGFRTGRSDGRSLGSALVRRGCTGDVVRSAQPHARGGRHDQLLGPGESR